MLWVGFLLSLSEQMSPCQEPFGAEGRDVNSNTAFGVSHDTGATLNVSAHAEIPSGQMEGNDFLARQGFFRRQKQSVEAHVFDDGRDESPIIFNGGQ